MNTNDRSVFKLLHSPADFAPEGRGHDVAAALERAPGSFECELPMRLELNITSADGGPVTLGMTPCDSFEADGRRFEIYSAHIPAAVMKKGTLGYTIEGGGCRGEYSVAVTALPQMPPLIITEIFNRPKDKNVTSYLELYAPGDTDTDLYDWELIISSEKLESPLRLPLSLCRGENVLHPGETVVWWPLFKGNFGVKPDGGDRTTPDDFCREMNSMYHPPVPPVTPDTVRIIPVAYFRRDAESGEIVRCADVSAIPTDYVKTTVRLVPRGADADAAVYTLEYSTVWGRWDCPVRRSSYWWIDSREPSRAVNISHAADATPGWFAYGQAPIDTAAPLPVILPVTPARAVYIGDGDCDISFAVSAVEPECDVASAWASLDMPDGSEKRIAAHRRDDGLYHACIPAEDVERMTVLTYSLHAFDGARTVGLTGLSAAVYDNAGPRVTSMRPTEKYAYDITAGTAVRASFYDISGVKLSECRLLIDGRDVTARAVWSDDGMVYEPAVPMAVGAHELRLVLCDMLGNHSVKEVRFSVSDMSDLCAYHGEVHSHTAESDGTGTLGDAYRYARDVGHVDFFAPTDHSHHIVDGKEGAALIKREADKFDDPGRFAALWGYEMTWNMTCGYWGHVNVIGSDNVEGHIDTTTLPDLYAMLEKDPDAVAMFNHPGFGWGNFDEYAYRTAGADKKVCLSEIRGAAYDREYSDMLAAGWHASPVSNEDNHSPEWTTATTQTSFVLAPALTRENIMDAFRARRTYTASDPTLVIKYRVNGKWLGSHLDDPEALKFDISVSTENEEGIGRVEIVAEDNIVVAARNAGARRSFEWHPTLAPDFDYYYLRITAPKRYSATAPVWIDRKSPLSVSDIETGAPISASSHGTAARLRITNSGEKPADGVRVDFYLGKTSGFDLRDEEPYATVHCGRLAAGASLKVSRAFPELPEMHRLSAVVSADIRGERKRTATVCTLVTPVTVTEILPYSMPLEKEGGVKVDDPFPYITLYNSSLTAQDIGGALLRLWVKTGKAPSEDRSWRFPAGTIIPPRSGLVVWVRYEDPTLTVGDFNERYGTSLIEGGNIIICDKHILSRADCGRRLELVTDEVMSRVQWNYASTCDGDAHRGSARRYEKRPGLSATSAPLGLAEPHPGSFSEGQIHAEFSTTPTHAEAKQRRRDEKAEAKRAERSGKLTMTDGEAAVLAAATAAAAGGIAALIGALTSGKKRKGNR